MTSKDMEKVIAGKVGSYRWKVITALFLLYTINLFDRFAVLTFLPLIRADLNLTHVEISMAVSIFFFIYAFAQAWSGWLADKIGAKKVIYIGVTVFTFVSFVTGMVQNFFQLMLARIGLALGEGHHWSPTLALVAKWIPQQEKARATAVLVASGSVAPMFIPIVLTTLAVALGSWRPVFYMLIIPGVVGLLVLWYYVWDSPDDAKQKGRITQTEVDHIKAGIITAEKSLSTMEALRFLARDPHLYLYGLFMFLATALNWGNNSWLSTFLMEQHGLNLKTMGLVASVPYVVSLASVFLSGWMVDKLFKGRMKPLLLLSLIPSAIIFYALGQVAKGNIPILIGMLFCVGFFAYLWTAAYSYAAKRYPKELVGTAVGFSQLCAQFGGFAALPICGSLVKKTAEGGFDHSNVMVFFAVVAALALVVGLMLDDKGKYTLDSKEKEGLKGVSGTASVD